MYKRTALLLILFIAVATPVSAQSDDAACCLDLKQVLEKKKSNAVLTEVIKGADFFSSPIYEAALRAIDDPDYTMSWQRHDQLQPNPETAKKDVVCFGLDDDRPLTAFAGIWTEYAGDRGTKAKPVPGPHLIYGFLTTEPNAVVAPIHPKAMLSS